MINLAVIILELKTTKDDSNDLQVHLVLTFPLITFTGSFDYFISFISLTLLMKVLLYCKF